ncbi:MAG: DNA repair protein RecN [Gammaproteobacteria bacterium]|nr:DNA repair protein RecN [Gammaproteobacteria bacterium]MCP5137901.1 DNA repair protein RecN [Gammaproteobacteria bacterium]
MLSHIHIRDFAIIDSLELDLDSGMTAMTGETGAGKSILVDALGFLLGDRADSGFVRQGADRTDLAATFVLHDAPLARTWLAEQDMDADEDELLLRRVIGADGRSKAWINGSPAPLQLLRELGEHLLDIHGQHEHQSLLKKGAQRLLLDAYAGLGDTVATVSGHYRQWRDADQRLRKLQNAADDRETRLDLLRFQVQELDALGLGDGEWSALNEEHATLANAGRLLEGTGRALNLIYDAEEGTVHDLLSQSNHEIAALAEIDARLAPLCELLEGALIQTREAADELRRYTDSVDLDPARLQWAEERISDCVRLARKHRIEPEELPAQLSSLQAELDDLEKGGETLEALQAQVEKLSHAYLQAARDLSAQRQAAAQDLGGKVSAAMHELGMTNGIFVVLVNVEDETRFAAHGLDDVEFLVSANAGQSPRSLAKVASGGELSRISLAIQVITARTGGVPSMVFDEVDSGVGGGIAEVVGRQLRELGEQRQVLCVTHLPQVAAQAHHHMQVAKSTRDGLTHSRIDALNDTARIDEIARMLGGIEITDQALAHAREMIERANS